MGGRPPLIPIGHNIIIDMKSLMQHGLHLSKHFDIVGIADTQTLLQDLKSQPMPESLTDLVLMYQLYPPVDEQIRTNRNKTKRTFLGAPCAGNDAVANLKFPPTSLRSMTFVPVP